jgi:hypothetical protein
MAVKRFIETFSFPAGMVLVLVLSLVLNDGLGLVVTVSSAADDKDRMPVERKAVTSRNGDVNDDEQEE